MKVIVLIENTSKCSLCAEHGPSVYIEYNGMKYLLDAGGFEAPKGLILLLLPWRNRQYCKRSANGTGESESLRCHRRPPYVALKLMKRIKLLLKKGSCDTHPCTTTSLYFHLHLILINCPFKQLFFYLFKYLHYNY